MSGDRRLQGLALKVGPVGGHGRPVTLLSDGVGVIRLAVPGARRPRSSLAAAVPLTCLDLQVVGRRGLARVRQLQVQRSYSGLGQRLDTLAAAQALAELAIALVSSDDPVPGLLDAVLIHLERLDNLSRAPGEKVDHCLAHVVQAGVHLLALGGYGLPLQACCRSGATLTPPIGQWEWRCSVLPEEGLALGALAGATIQLNPSELALLQRLPRAELPRRSNGDLLGPRPVWLKLLAVLECWCRVHLPSPVRSLTMVRDCVSTASLSEHEPT